MRLCQAVCDPSGLASLKGNEGKRTDKHGCTAMHHALQLITVIYMPYDSIFRQAPLSDSLKADVVMHRLT
jgi:hypothetical protein